MKKSEYRMLVMERLKDSLAYNMNAFIPENAASLEEDVERIVEMNKDQYDEDSDENGD